MIRIKAHITFLLICLCGLLEAQENVQLKEVKVTRDRSLMRPQDLYGNAEAMPPHIGNVFQLDIFKDQIGQEVWYTQSQCLTVRQEVDLMPGGESGMYLEWNKLRPDCGVDNNWFGLGIGWDGWAAKDIYGIIDSAAIRLKVKSAGGDIKGLPLAMCLEDYADKQAWIGLTPDRIVNAPIVDDEWRDVVLPLNAFDWNEQNANPSNIKQMIIQFEAEGSMIVDKIDLIRKPAPPRYRTDIVVTADTLILDGFADRSMQREPNIELPSGKAIWLTANERYISLFLEAAVNDKRGEIVGLDLVLSSNAEAPDRRKGRIMSDHWFATDLRKGASRSVSMNKELTKGGTARSIRGERQSIEWLIHQPEALYSGLKAGEELLLDLRITFERRGEQITEIWNCQTEEFGEVPLRWGFVSVVKEEL